MKRMIALMALIATVSGLSSAQKMPSIPYIQIKSITSCWHTAQSDSGGTGWYPAVKIKFTPKADLLYAEFGGTFVNSSTGDSLGHGIENAVSLEVGINYTLQMNAYSGWYTPTNRKARVTPTFAFTKVGSSDRKSYKLPTITKFSANTPECDAVN